MAQRMESRPIPSAPRKTGGWCGRISSPWLGRSPEGWQLRQRGLVRTLLSSVKIAAERSVLSAIAEKLSGAASVFEVAPDTDQAANRLAARLTAPATEIMTGK